MRADGPLVSDALQARAELDRADMGRRWDA